MHEHDIRTPRGRAELLRALRPWRMRYELSLDEAAKLAGIDRESLRRYERGERMPHRAMLEALRALVATHVPPRWPSADELRAWRVAHGMTHTELAQRIGISRRVLYRLRTAKPIARTRARLVAFWSNAA